MGLEMGSDVKVKGVLTVVSSTPVKQGSTCPLTALDHAMDQHDLHVIFYYRAGSLNLPRIRPGLNEVLSLYPNVTGRLVKDGDGNWEVKCTDAGVRVFLARVRISVDEWLRSAGRDDEMHLTAMEDLADDPQIQSPFRIQITEFEGGGAAIALSCPHMQADPISATLFIKSWTEAHHREAISHPPFLHPASLSSATTTNNSATAYYANKAAVSDTPEPSLKMASATFSFSHSVINQSLSKIRSTVPDATPFDYLTALFWTRIARLKAHNQTRSISICTDMRKRLKAPLPYGYFGNALHFSQLTFDAPTEMDSSDLCHMAGLVHSHVVGLQEEEFWSSVGWLESRKDEKGKLGTSFRMYGPELTCVNMEHMIGPVGKESRPLMYMARFEKDGMPSHVSYRVGNVAGEGLILVMPSPEEGLARRVDVTLPEEEMEKLLEDKLILCLEPTLLLSGKN